MRHLLSVSVAVALVACGGGTLTVSEYAAEAESLVATMRQDFASLDRQWESEEPSLEGAQRYWQGRLTVRRDFLGGVEALNPPEAIEAQHAAAVDVFNRITAADEALAVAVQGYDTISSHWQWVETPEGRAADALLEEVYAFCRASQAEYDATQDRSAFKDMPWIPSEMSEVVSVAFGCPPP